MAGSEVDDFFVLEEIFCQLFSACEHAHDVARADQWIRIGEAIAERRRLPAVSAFCRTHYGGVLTAAGRWPEADAALTEAVRLWGLGQRSLLRSGALVRLADLRVRQGRFEEAEQLLDGIDVTDDAEAARPLAAIHLAKGETVARRRRPRAGPRPDRSDEHARRRRCWRCSSTCTSRPTGSTRPSTAADALATCAARHQSHYLMAVAALARGRVCLAAGTGDPQACLREALAGFARAQMPMEVAHSRLELANALRHRAARGGDGRGAGRARGVRPAAGGPPRRRRRGRAAVARRPGHDGQDAAAGS